MKTKSYAMHSKNDKFQPYDFTRRDVGPNDIAIEIKYCGICHSDIHTARSEWGEANYPCVPGHEIVGTVKQIGATVDNFKIGSLVGVGCMVDSCQDCNTCEQGFEQYCENGFTGTYNSNISETEYTMGGYSDYIVVDKNFVLQVPENLDPAAVAPLLCAGITTYSPFKILGLKKGDKVAVNGLGGLGHMAVKIAASFGAEVTMLSRSPNKKADAERLGAHNFLLTNDLQGMNNARNSFDIILDTVSANHDLNALLSTIKLDGTLIMVGLPEKPLPVSVFSLIANRRRMMGSLIGGIKETQEMLDHCAKHNIVSDIELIEPKDINTAYERVLKSDVKYRFVIDCSKF